MLADLAASFGGLAGVVELLGVPSINLSAWTSGQAPSYAARKAIWLTWCLLLHPECLQTAFDIATWGIGRPVKTRPARLPSESFMLVASSGCMDGDGI